MDRMKVLIFGIALVLPFSWIALATSINLSASSHVIIYAFDQNPPGSDKGSE